MGLGLLRIKNPGDFLTIFNKDGTMKKSAIILMAVLAVFIGCNAQKGKSSSGSGGKDGELEPIIFASCVALEFFGDAALFVADDLGYFEQEGLKIQFEEAFGTADAKMVSVGQAQFAFPSPGIILTSIEAGMDLKAVFSHMPVNIFGFAAKKGALNSFADLKGKSIALGDASWASIGAPIIKAAGLDPDKDVKWVSVGDARYQSTASGETDALLTWDVEFGYILGLGFDLEYLDADSVLPQLSNTVVVNSKYLNEHPGTVVKFNRALAKGMYFCLQNPAAAADIVLKKYPAIDVSFDGGTKTIEWQLESYFGSTEAEQKEALEKIGLFHEERWTTTIQAAKDSGVIKSAPPLNELYTNEYIDFSWDRAAVEADAKKYVFGSDAYKKSR
jgi:ABC-type nitrate/sulfonate/bicarbonate transport system substrate-binding protein